MSRAYPHVDDGTGAGMCRCNALRPLALDGDVETWGSACPAAMRDHIAELEWERTTAHEAGRRSMCVQAGGYPDSDLDGWAEANRRMGDALDEARARVASLESAASAVVEATASKPVLVRITTTTSPDGVYASGVMTARMPAETGDCRTCEHGLMCPLLHLFDVRAWVLDHTEDDARTRRSKSPPCPGYRFNLPSIPTEAP